jgi:hypothetical protein
MYADGGLKPREDNTTSQQATVRTHAFVLVLEIFTTGKSPLLVTDERPSSKDDIVPHLPH